MGRPFRIERSIQISASPEAVFAVAADLARWNDWSPYFRAAPETAFTVSSPSNGVGALYTWEGRKAGSGRMEITSQVPDQSVTLRLEFFAPFKAVNQTDFSCAPAPGGGTRFTWAMSGDRPWFMVVMAFLFRLDRMLAGQFDEGLQMLKGVVERA